MKIGEDGFFHLAYCSNIHPGESWEEVRSNLRTYLPDLKRRLSPGAPFGVGLRLSNRAAVELEQRDRLAELKGWLDDNDLYVFTLNGFPYGGFHRQVVKDQVYAPDWRAKERVAYTLRLAQILSVLLPDGLDGGISTSPLSYKPWLDHDGRTAALEQGAVHFADVAYELARLYQETGKLLHVDIEPEPDCLIENLGETISFFREWLFRQGARRLSRDLQVARGAAESILREHIRVCYDTCHFAVEYEEPGRVFERLFEGGIQIGKIQISAALKVGIPRDPAERDGIRGRLQPFAESTYLHQTIERTREGVLRHYPDLPDALGRIGETDGVEWRTHFHVPIFLDHYAGLDSTQADIVASLKEARATRACSHLEIETYTWEVLPPDLKIDLADSIAREYEWVLGQFGSRGWTQDRPLAAAGSGGGEQ